MEEIITKEEFNKFMELEGKARGLGRKNSGEYILKKEGEEGLKKLEDTMAELGYPMKYREIKAIDFYPLGLVAITLLAIKRLFNYDDKKFQEMGKFDAESSFFPSLFIKYLGSLGKLVKEVPEAWKIYFTVGSLKVIQYNEAEKYLILKLEDFELTPIHCQYLIGYFPAIFQMILGAEATCEETKCTFRGDDYHEFLVKW